MSSPREHKFTVLLAVYWKEHPDFLRQCLNSLLAQTFPPDEILIVKDGLLTTALDLVIEDFQNRFPSLKVIGYSENKGLSHALNVGLAVISSPFVARMDTDDIAAIDRFEKQYRFMMDHPATDVLGSNTYEFANDPREIVAKRITPEHHDAILRKAKRQNPMNHMTVFLKKAALDAVGGYRDVHFEDYDLWYRMLMAGFRFHNLQEGLVFARTGNDMIGRRHGYWYMKHELVHFRNMKSDHFISPVQFFLIMLVRLPLRLLPKKMLTAVYSLFLRKN